MFLAQSWLLFSNIRSYGMTQPHLSGGLVVRFANINTHTIAIARKVDKTSGGSTTRTVAHTLLHVLLELTYDPPYRKGLFICQPTFYL